MIHFVFFQMPRIKIWSCNRQKKFAFTFSVEEDVEVVIQKGSKKLNCLGRKLVAEDDGTEVDDVDGFIHYSSIDKPVLLLQEDEIWLPSNMNLVQNSYEVEKGAKTAEQVQGTNDAENHVDESHLNENPSDGDPNDENRVLGNAEKEECAEKTVLREGKAKDDFEDILASRRAAFTSWEQYTVPWVQILSSSDLDRCRRGVEKATTQRNVVHAIVTDILFYRVPIKRKYLTLIAIQCISTFPDTFEDKDEYGSRIDNGYNGILQKLQDHINYLNRVPKKRPGLSQHLNLKLKHRRMLQSVQNGTVNWQPEDCDVADLQHPKNSN